MDQNQDLPLLVFGNRNYSSWSLRAWFFLKAIGVTFEEERLALETDEFREIIDDYSPSGRVPVLLIGDEIIWDSFAICVEMADRRNPMSSWPESDKLRALARSICSEIHSGFFALKQQMPMNCRATGRKVPMTPELETDIYRVCHIWRENRARSADAGPWLFGDFTIADAYFAPIVFRFRTYGVDLGPEEQAYCDSVLGHPAIQEWLAAAESEQEVIESEEFGR